MPGTDDQEFIPGIESAHRLAIDISRLAQGHAPELFEEGRQLDNMFRRDTAFDEDFDSLEGIKRTDMPHFWNKINTLYMVFKITYQILEQYNYASCLKTS